LIPGRRERLMNRLRIAMVAACPFPTSQGTQVFIGQLARALRGRGHQIYLLTYHYGDKSLDSPAPLHRSWRLPISAKLGSGPSLQKPIFDLLLAMKLNQVVQRQRVHIIHAHNYEGALVGLAVGRLRKVPLIFHTHNTMTHELPSYSRSRLGRHATRWLGGLLDHQLPRRADACIAVSPDIAAFVRRLGAEASKTWTIPPAIEADQFQTCRKMPDDRKGAVPRLLYAGNLDNYQNFGLILESLTEVLAQYPQCLLEVVTNSPTTRLLSWAKRMGLRESVHFTQTTSFQTMAESLARCDLALCPRISPYGFPIKLLNYLAAGKPVIICRGSARAIRHRVNGWVVEDNDVPGFARAIVTLLKDQGLRRRLSDNAWRLVREKFSWERWVPKYEEVYHQTLADWRPPS
jgi:1,2-diacylglycerol 3-alpha-glucosyltransferase